MVIEFDSSRFLFGGDFAPVDGGERLPDIESGFVEGGLIGDGIPDIEGGELDGSETLPIVPTNQYRKTRHEGNLSFVPESGGTPLQPAQQLITGPAIRFTVTERETSGFFLRRAQTVFYRWTGFFDFDNADHNFSIIANGPIRVKLDGRAIIDDFIVSAPRRTKIERVLVTAGRHLVTVEWGVRSGEGNIAFAVDRIAVKTWRSCEDGLTRDGDPPEGWILTETGCFKPPLTGDDDTPVIDLLQVVDVVPGPETRVERAYILGSGAGLSAHRLKFFNRSTNMTVNVALGGPKPVRFVTAFQFLGDVGVGGLPANSFELPTQGEKLIDVLFNTGDLDELPEGLIRSDILVALGAGTITIAKDQDDNIDVGEPLPPDEPIELPPEDPELPPPPPPPTPTWRDCSAGTEVVRDGFPPDDFILRSDGCYIAPPPPLPEIRLNVAFNELEPRFDGSRSIARVLLIANLIGGDPSTFSFSWNFDVNRQGAGTGDTTKRTPTVSYRLTDTDLRRLEDSLDGKMTRSVEVIARKGTVVVRSRRTVILDDSKLKFIEPVILPPIEEGIIEPEEPFIGDGGGGGGGFGGIGPGDDSEFLLF